MCYIVKVLGIMEDSNLQLSFLWLKNKFTKDTFTFPAILGEASVAPTKCKGVLLITCGGTKRQADLIKVFTPLTAFNMH